MSILRTLYKVLQAIPGIILTLIGLNISIFSVIRIIANMDIEKFNFNLAYSVLPILLFLFGILLFTQGIKLIRTVINSSDNESKSSEEIKKEDVSRRKKSMVAKLKRLLITYACIALSFVVLDKALLFVTGQVFSKSTIYQGGVLTVEKGVAYQNYWSQELIFYAIMAVTIGTMLSFWQTSTIYSSKFQSFLLSKRINATSGIVLLFCGIGIYTFTHRIPDSFSDVMALINTLACLLVIVRWFAKEIYVLKKP